MKPKSRWTCQRNDCDLGATRALKFNKYTRNAPGVIDHFCEAHALWYASTVPFTLQSPLPKGPRR